MKSARGFRHSAHQSIVEFVNDWSDYLRLITGPLKNWGFRGHQDTSWLLETTLTRHLNKRNVQRRHWYDQEYHILWIFQRKASHFLDEMPPVDDVMHWLALMQHHGAPTRMLDFTWSPYVAAFFALEPSAGEAAVWAVNTLKLGTYYFPPTSAKKNRVPHPEDFLKQHEGGRNNGVVFGEPFFKNRRLIAQSGTFACPVDITRPIDEVLGHRADLIRKIVFRKEARKFALQELYSMNITYATLFPDLDGLSRSLGYELESHWGFDPTQKSEAKEANK
jgi:FRG domain-containing protein